jgi:hypothetical protein
VTGHFGEQCMQITGMVDFENSETLETRISDEMKKQTLETTRIYYGFGKDLCSQVALAGKAMAALLFIDVSYFFLV